MARVDKRRNVVLIVTTHPNGASTTPSDKTTWRVCPVEVDDDGGITAGTEVTSTVSLDAALDAVRTSSLDSDDSPFSTIPYHTRDILEVVLVPPHVIDAAPVPAEYFPGTA